MVYFDMAIQQMNTVYIATTIHIKDEATISRISLDVNTNTSRLLGLQQAWSNSIRLNHDVYNQQP